MGAKTDPHLRKRRSMSRSYWVGNSGERTCYSGDRFWTIGKNGNIDKTLVVADHKEVRLILPDGSAHDLSVLETTTENMNIPGFRGKPRGYNTRNRYGGNGCSEGKI